LRGQATSCGRDVSLRKEPPVQHLDTRWLAALELAALEMAKLHSSAALALQLARTQLHRRLGPRADGGAGPSGLRRDLERRCDI
jgi:hypothetical protein